MTLMTQAFYLMLVKEPETQQIFKKYRYVCKKISIIRCNISAVVAFI